MSAKQGKLAGKRIAFVGKPNYQFDQCQKLVAFHGGKMVGPDSSPDYLVVGEGRGGKPPSEVANLKKQFPQLHTLDLVGLCRLLIPDRDELLRQIQARELDAADHHSNSGWHYLDEAMSRCGATLDLSGVDLRGAPLDYAKLACVTLDGANLSGAKMRLARVGSLKGVNFDRVEGEHFQLANATDCTFREANLVDAQLLDNATLIDRCDFTGATMPRTRFVHYQGDVRDSTFRRADLSGADLGRIAFTRVDFRDANLTGLRAAAVRFIDCDLRGAMLCRADLRNAVLPNADLRGVDLRDATLTDADLTGAKLDDADFAGAVVAGLKLSDVDVRQARNLGPTEVRQPGPKLQELAAAVAETTSFVTSAEVDVSQGRFAKLFLVRRADDGGPTWGKSEFYNGDDTLVSNDYATTFERAMLNLAALWPKAQLRLDTITTKGGQGRRQRWQSLAVAAWSEVFGTEGSADELARAQSDAARAECAALVAKMCAEGVSAWSEIDYRLRERFADFSGADFSGVDLTGVDFWKKNLAGCRFHNATLIGAELNATDLRNADFAGANLCNVSLQWADCRGANFTGANVRTGRLQQTKFGGANLTGANLSDAELCNADLRGANLTDANLSRANLSGAKYDTDTRLPARFTPPVDMIWHGPARPAPAGRPAGSLSFASFIEALNDKVDAERLRTVMALMRKQSFSLFAAVDEAELVGVVESQSEQDRVYACRLASDGAFCCATQNLKPCGGLRGGLCKHLLALVVGLTRAGQLDAATADAWIDASRSRKAALDKDALAATFVRHQAASGSDDWRPTITAPKDFREP